MGLKAKVKFLEKQKTSLEQQAFHTDKKAVILDKMICIAEKEYQINIPKNTPPNNLKNNKNNQ